VRRRDFSSLDLVMAAAERARQRVILTLANNWQECDGFAKDTHWYAAGFRAHRIAGAAAFLPWDWVPPETGGCNFDIAPGDPVLALLAKRPR
jgi:hypothetical protein